MSLHNFSSMTPDDICVFWREELPSLDEYVIETFRQSGIAFIELNDEYLRELCPVLGDHMKIKKIVQTCVQSISSPSTPKSCALNSSSMSKGQTPCSSLCSGDTVPVRMIINFFIFNVYIFNNVQH